MSDPETLWLNVTNIALGVVTAVCLIALGSVVIREVWGAARSRVRVPAADPHELVLQDLGVTMADGGEKIDEQSEVRKRRGDENSADGQNIVRSDN